MFNKKYEDRLRVWREFRLTLESSNDPITDVVCFYSKAPMVSIQVDPWEPKSWLGPWELLYENNYCEFSKILAICYTLQLTDSFSDAKFQIHICTNSQNSESKYLLYIDNKVIGYDYDNVIDVTELPKLLRTEVVYVMPKLQ